MSKYSFLRLVKTITISVVILSIINISVNLFNSIQGFLPLTILQNAKAEPGFIANTTEQQQKSLAVNSDPNYRIYKNLGLGFSIEYLKNMTVTQSTDNSSFRTSQKVVFISPNNTHINYNTRIIMRIVVTPATGAFGIPLNLDDGVRQFLIASSSPTSNVLSKTKGNLDGSPAYRVEMTQQFPNINNTSPPSLHYINYLTIKGGELYIISFITSANNFKNLIPVEKKMIDSFQFN